MVVVVVADVVAVVVVWFEVVLVVEAQLEVVLEGAGTVGLEWNTPGSGVAVRTVLEKVYSGE